MAQYQFQVNSATDTGALTWNANGTLAQLAIADNIPATSDTQTCTYTHDDLGRIAAANCGTVWSQAFTFDALGNLSKSGTQSFGANFGINNRIGNNLGFVPNYDADGNLLDDPVTPQRNVNAYDAEGKAVTLEGVSVTYDALGRAVEAAEPGGAIEFLYGPEGRKLAVMSGPSLDGAYIPLPGGGTAVYHGASLAYYRHADGLGSSRLASTPTRQLYSATAYAPYGEPYQEAQTVDRSFTGQNQDISGGQYDFLERELNPIQGRWWTPDPAGLAAVDPSNPQSWNRYGYVGNQPTEAIDPTGLCGNVVIGGSTQTGGTPDVFEQTLFANSIGADLAFPFAHQSLLGSFGSIEAAAFGGGSDVLVAAAAISHTAANGGPFTIFAFSGGAQVAQAALGLLPASVASRATVVGISPGFGFGPISLAPSEALTVSGLGGFNGAVAGTAILNGLNPGPGFSSTCRHEANCEFQQASPTLSSFASASCGKPATFSRGTGAGGGVSGGGSGGGGWGDPFYFDDLIWAWLAGLNPIEVVTHTIKYKLK